MINLLNNTLKPAVALVAISISFTHGGCQTIDKTSAPPPSNPAAIVLDSPPTEAPIGIREGHESPDITPAAKASAPLYAWTQYGDAGNLSARAILPTSTAAACPSITIDGITSGMSKRADGSGDTSVPRNFSSIIMCQYDVPMTAKTITIGPMTLAGHVSDPQKIAVIGDTGCRVKGGTPQNCNGKGPATPWNYAGIASAVSGENPDMILHVGDYHYRERCESTSSCKNAGVDPATVGLKWESWEADFFKPSGKMLSAAPLILTRGNHEDCSRAGTGWFYLLDPSNTYKQCETMSPSYKVTFDHFQVAVIDTSNSNKLKWSIPQLTSAYKTVFGWAKAAPSKPTWITTHVPTMAATAYGLSDKSLISASTKAAGFPAEVAMNLAGHVHLFEKLEFTDGNPPQMVFGASGTRLEHHRLVPRSADCSHWWRNKKKEVSCQLKKLNADSTKFLSSLSFDYGIFTSNGIDWNVDVKTIDGQAPLNFSIPKNRVVPTGS